MSAVLEMDAAEMQSTLVPPLRYRGDCLEAHGQCIPKDEVGGDLMEMIKTAMRYGLLLQRPLGNLISDLNRLLPQVKEPSMFATLAALRFDGSNEVEYVSAGHVPLLHFRKRTNDVITHHAQQFPLGLLPGHAVVTRRIPYEAGDVFVLPTDGALELGEEPDAEAGLAVLARTLSRFHDDPLPEILDILQSEISRHGAQHDDRTILLVRALCGSSRQSNDPSCHALLEARWQQMLAELAKWT